MKTGVYQIRNLLNGVVYIGGAYKNFVTRKSTHFYELGKGTHDNPRLQNAWNKYGSGAFVFEIVQRCVPEKVQEYEQKWLDRLWAKGKSARYNINPQASTQFLPGHPTPNEVKERIANTLRGRPLPAELKAKLSLIHQRPEQREKSRKGAQKQWASYTLEQRRNSLKKMLDGAKDLRGENHYKSVLTEAVVLEARSLREQGWTYKSLQKRYGCGYITIYKAVVGVTWSHV